MGLGWELVVIYIDGSVTGNPGGVVGYGWICPDLNENGFGAAFQGGESSTNNVAEWMGVIAALIFVLGNEDWSEPLLIKSDSELLVHQMNGEWRVKHSN